MRKSMMRWYVRILSVCISVCATEASAQSERSGMLPDYESRDDLLKQPALKIAAQDSADSSTTWAKAGRVFISFAYSRKTYVPAIGSTLERIGMYVPELSLPLTFVDTETGSSGVSFTPFMTLTFGIMAEWLAGEQLGVRWLQSAIRYGLLIPALALNSSHHLVLMRKGAAMESPVHELTAFLGWRTDLWENFSRWTPMAGLQYSFVERAATTEGSMRGGLGLCTGVEAPVDLPSQGKAIPARVFVGLKWYIWAGD